MTIIDLLRKLHNDREDVQPHKFWLSGVAYREDLEGNEPQLSSIEEALQYIRDYGMSDLEVEDITVGLDNNDKNSVVMSVMCAAPFFPGHDCHNEDSKLFMDIYVKSRKT